MSENGLPRAVAVAWGVAEFPQRGPKRELSHEGIVDAATEIADAEGLEAVTMQRVAASFGFTTMALYRYIASKDELHRLMCDAALQAEDLAAIPDDDWRVGIRAWAATMAECYRRHPWLLDMRVDADVLIMPNNMAFVDAGLRALQTLPVAALERLAILLSTSLLVRGFIGVQHQLLTNPDGGYRNETMEAVREIATGARFPHLAPLVQSGAYFGDAPHPAQAERVADAEVEADLGLGLEIYLDGVAARAARGEAVEPTGPPAPADAQEAFALAEQSWKAGVAGRKAAERRVKELYKREDELRRLRDAAKEVAKAEERMRRQRG